jgi:hypothetical protein
MPHRSGKARSFSAISMAADLGRRIQSDHAEVVAMYRRFTPLSTMARRLGLMKGYGVSERIARNAIEYALRGFPGGYRAASYEGLITDADELKAIVSGYRKKTGNKLKRQKKGFCGQTKEERRRAAIAGATAVGWIVFTEKEIECATRLCAAPRFCYESGRHKGKPQLELVAQELNKRFHKGHSVRDRHSVNFLRGRSKRQKASASN